jgi:cyclic pyranopterin phosphate synthase
MTPLIDTFGRVHNNLRVSVTDRCNIRCFYCMPENVRFRPRAEILTFEEIVRFVRVVATAGINKIRLTGGEPLVRSGLADLIRELRRIKGISDIALTTNGILLADQAESLKHAGLDRLNVSLDTLEEETFRKITRREGLQQVLDGIAAAKGVGFERIRLNAIAARGLTEEEIVPLAHFARSHGFELRFIEFMPLDGDENWAGDSVLDGASILDVLGREFGELVPAARDDSSQPAVDYEYADGQGRIGLISSVTQPFCRTCNRLRITAEGQVRNCLFSTAEWDVRAVMRSGGDDAGLLQLVRDAIAAKKPGHGSDDLAFVRPERAMYQIGG